LFDLRNLFVYDIAIYSQAVKAKNKMVNDFQVEKFKHNATEFCEMQISISQSEFRVQ
ncbi:7965_t:CDS:1, partial [Entrophospora sp. SA101]